MHWCPTDLKTVPSPKKAGFRASTMTKSKNLSQGSPSLFCMMYCITLSVYHHSELVSCVVGREIFCFTLSFFGYQYVHVSFHESLTTTDIKMKRLI